MEYQKIINNILTDPNQISKCINTLEKSEEDGRPLSELLHIARYLALENADFDSLTNVSDTFNSILNELDCVTSHTTSKDTVISLQISSILDSVLEKLSKTELTIYIYRYFLMDSLDNISNLCNCSINSITKTLSTINETLKHELNAANIKCTTKTLLISFSDIDESFLLAATKNNTREFTSKPTDQRKNPLSLFKDSILKNVSYKKILNVCFASLIILLIIINIDFPTDDTTKIKDNNNQTTEDSFNEFESLFMQTSNNSVVNTKELLRYKQSFSPTAKKIYYDTEHFSASYSEMQLDSSIPLSDCLGEEIASLRSEDKKFYKLKGHRGTQYIIREYLDTYIFYCLSEITYKEKNDTTSEDISFLEVTKNYFGLFSTSQIKNITIKNAGPNNNSADFNVKRLIDNQNDISKIFDILIKCKYVNPLNTDVSSNNQSPDNNHLITSVQLLIELNDGTVIDSIYYIPEYHYFYETNSPIAFMPEDISSTSTNKSPGIYLDTMLSFN